MKKSIIVGTIFVAIIGLIVLRQESQPKPTCREVVKEGKVIRVFETVSKDFVFTGAIWSDRKMIVEFKDNTRAELANNDNRVEGDNYIEKHQECY